MKSRAFEVARLGELERFENEFVTIPVRIPLGIRAFGVNWAQADSDLDAIRGEPGFPG